MVLLCAGFFLLSGAGCGRHDGSPVVARVGKKVITKRDVDERIAKLPSYYVDLLENGKQEFVTDLVNDELLFQEARRRGLDKDKEVRQIIQEAERKILISRLIRDEVENKLDVSDAAIEQFYRAHQDEFMTPVRMRASHILVNDRDAAQIILERLRSGENFEDLARSLSIDATSERGGDIGYFSRGQIIPQFDEACSRLSVGQVSEVVSSPFGYHLIKLTERIDAQPIDLASVSDTIRERLRRGTKKSLLAELIERLRRVTPVTINEEVIK